MSYLINNLRTRRIAFFAIALAAFAQFSLVTHEVLVEHSLGEHCEMCVAQDRFDDAALAAVVTAAVPLFTPSSLVEFTTVAFTSAAIAAVRNRGPPIL